MSRAQQFRNAIDALIRSIGLEPAALPVVVTAVEGAYQVEMTPHPRDVRIHLAVPIVFTLDDEQAEFVIDTPEYPAPELVSTNPDGGTLSMIGGRLPSKIVSEIEMLILWSKEDEANASTS